MAALFRPNASFTSSPGCWHARGRTGAPDRRHGPCSVCAAHRLRVPKLHALTATTLRPPQVERLLAEGAVKEAASGDKTRLEGALSEALREVAVHKALADGWQRDIKVGVECDP